MNDASGIDCNEKASSDSGPIVLSRQQRSLRDLIGQRGLEEVGEVIRQKVVAAHPGSDTTGVHEPALGNLSLEYLPP